MLTTSTNKNRQFSQHQRRFNNVHYVHYKNNTITGGTFDVASVFLAKQKKQQMQQNQTPLLMGRALPPLRYTHVRRPSKEILTNSYKIHNKRGGSGTSSIITSASATAITKIPTITIVNEHLNKNVQQRKISQQDMRKHQLEQKTLDLQLKVKTIEQMQIEQININNMLIKPCVEVLQQQKPQQQIKENEEQNNEINKQSNKLFEVGVMHEDEVFVSPSVVSSTQHNYNDDVADADAKLNIEQKYFINSTRDICIKSHRQHRKRKRHHRHHNYHQHLQQQQQLQQQLQQQQLAVLFNPLKIQKPHIEQNAD